MEKYGDNSGHIAAEIGKPIAMDHFIDQLQKLGYIRIQVEIDSMELLKSGVPIKGRNRVIWQPFVYSNILVMCYQYG